MSTESARHHWESIYATKQPDEVSWTQPVPKTSLDFLRSFGLDKQARIIDIGGGDSHLVDFLVGEGYGNVTVLDISEHALNRAKQRLGNLADRVQWIVADVLTFRPETTYDVWHDRAAFHFMTTTAQIRAYLALARRSVRANGYLTIGTFSENGPTKCSGLEVRQYSELTLSSQLRRGFAKLRCLTEDHCTPFNTVQNFLFCSFQRQLEAANQPER
ncbi:class I SAM-dependent methyltransferase [Hymenobacter sp. BT175]|uniref:class I SAM-dependent methyltransferase n=1 Tax=Hymenobacter translucens TaxID=2886507 RepID=UPI001D0EFA30|nr:class I SAM-dependent methyltransferase [Hymenobacter translucens]MCC2546697.1 class I SAM-dependent methyltransferase [Hymenobacter translucens]